MKGCGLKSWRFYEKKNLFGGQFNGIWIDSGKVKIINDIKSGMKKKKVLELIGQPDEIFNEEFYYFNDEFDVLELKISFDKKNEISEIRIFMGS